MTTQTPDPLTDRERISRLEGAYEQVDRRLGDLAASMHRLDARFDAMDAKFDALRTDMDAKFDALRSEMTARFNALIAVIGGVGIAVASGIVFLALRIS